MKLFQLSFVGKFLIGCQFGGMETLSETFSSKFLGKVSHAVSFVVQHSQQCSGGMETFSIKFLAKVSHWLSVWWYGNFEVKLFQLSFLRKFLIGCEFGGMETFK